MKRPLIAIISLILWGTGKADLSHYTARQTCPTAGTSAFFMGEGYLPNRAIKCVPSLILGAG